MAGRRIHRWRWVAGAVGLVALGLFVWVALTIRSAGQAGYDGKEALESAESAIAAGDVEQADAALDDAEASFQDGSLEGPGPRAPAGRSAGRCRSCARRCGQPNPSPRWAWSSRTAARGITLAANHLLEPNDPDTSVADAVAALEEIQVALDDGVQEMRSAAERVSDLDGKRLFGNLGVARTQLSEELGPGARPGAGRAEGPRRRARVPRRRRATHVDRRHPEPRRAATAAAGSSAPSV